MSAHPQPGTHPDAESLNAFAEQALGLREREQLLAHLAVCGRCRQVVALAQEAAEMEAANVETAAPVPVPAPPAQRAIPWFRNRWIAWTPALALAGIVTVAVVMHMRRADESTESAKAFQPSLQQSAPQLQARPRQQETIDEPSSPLSAPPIPPTKGETPAQPREQASPANQALASAPPSPEAMTTAAFSSQPATVQPIPQSGATHGSVAGTVTASPASPALQPEVSFEANESAAWSQQDAAKQSVRQAMAINEGQAWTTGAAPAAKAASRKRIPSPALAPVTGGESAKGICAARTPQIAPLPSGLPAVSTVTSSYRVLALDKAGALFLSEDGGLHWQPITRQWTGHAVSVYLRPEAATQQLLAAAEEQGGVSSGSGPVFEISNEKKQVWTSGDGKTWSPQ